MCLVSLSYDKCLILIVGRGLQGEAEKADRIDKNDDDDDDDDAHGDDDDEDNDDYHESWNRFLSRGVLRVKPQLPSIFVDDSRGLTFT